MNKTVSLRQIAEDPTAFVGMSSPWRVAPVLMTRGTSFSSLCVASTMSESTGQGRLDALEATLEFMRSAGFLDPETTAVSLAIQDRKKTDPITIGRGVSNDVVIDHPSVSREHVRLTPPVKPGERWSILDLGSSNGTLVGGLPIRSGVRHELDEPIDAVSFGDLCFLFVDKDLFSLIVCEAVSRPWPEANRTAADLPAWRRTATSSETGRLERPSSS